VSYDVLIVGTGPAGSAAAALLAKAGHRVAMVGSRPFPRKPAGIGWVGGQAATLLEGLGPSCRKTLNRPIDDVTFLSADLGKSARPKARETAGYLIDRAAFETALIESATSAGAEARHGVTVSEIHLRENNVEARFRDHDPIEARILLLASGRSSPLAARIGLTATTGRFWAAYLWASTGKPSAGEKGSVNIVLGLTRDGGYGLTLSAAGQITVAVSVPGTKADAISRLTHLCGALAEQKRVPADLDPQPDRMIVVPPPLNALEMETHVGKHALLIGEAGGFVAAISNEGVVPAVWSASIAADVVGAALKSRQSQDKLMKFDTQWRLEMADYLRSPNTDMQFLVPLIFSNQPMADRMAAAFFRGDNI
jgi:flavin-dependent dehydrogenase